MAGVAWAFGQVVLQGPVVIGVVATVIKARMIVQFGGFRGQAVLGHVSRGCGQKPFDFGQWCAVALVL